MAGARPGFGPGSATSCALLATAASRSAFHGRRLVGVDPARFELADLPSLPVMTNTALPLIRYELGDSFTRQPGRPDHGHLRVTVVGRSDEILRYPGADVHPLVLRSVLLADPGVGRLRRHADTAWGRRARPR